MPDLKRNCRLSGKEFIVSEWEQEFLRKMGVPLPTLCIEERHRRRLAYRNERKIYKDTCDLTGKSMVSLYSPEKDFKVYSQEAWWSDKWDPRDYGRDYDFNKPFFEQFRELQHAVPRFSLMNTKAENSEYCNVTTSNRNCYLVFGGDFNEDCMYSVFCFKCKDCSDLYWVNRSELCYECIDCNDLYNCRYCSHAYNCRDSFFLYDCRSCSDCFGCVGLSHKQNYFFNREYTKEEYEKRVAEYNLEGNSGVLRAVREFAEFKLGFPCRAGFIINCENSSGNNLVNANNCVNCFDVEGPVEDLKDIILGGWGLTDVVSADHVGHGLGYAYEVVGCIGGNNYAFGTFNWDGNDLFYCDMVVNNCHDLFGCSNMKKSEYCVLNKQYSREEYFDLRARIVEHMKSTGEWGEFFPIENSPFCYNETIAQDYLPMMKDEVLSKGLRWLDEELQQKGSGETVPDSVIDVDENICDKTFVCAETGRLYKINEVELKLYKRLGVPIPHFAPETRNVMRFNSRNPWSTWVRKCFRCGESINTSFAPERIEKIYCEKCYMVEVY